MIKIKFNVLKNAFILGGSQCDVKSIDELNLSELANINKTNLPLIQMFNTGFRVINSTIDWSKWNGCVAVDIDSKNSKEEVLKNPQKVENMENKLVEFLATRYNHNFYFEQRSASGNSFHFFFYFNVDDKDKTIKNGPTTFKICSTLAINAVKDAFISNDYGEIVNTRGVVDDCSKRAVQGMYITKYPFKVNEYENFDSKYWGYIDLSMCKNIEIDTDYQPTEIKLDITKIKLKEKLSTHTTNWHNANRRRLITILAAIFGDNIEEAHVYYMHLYDGCFGKYIENHSRAEIESMFYKHYNNIKKSNYPFHSAMLTFCQENLNIDFSKVFLPRKIEMVKYNEVYTLDKDKYISSIIDKLYRDYRGITYIYAGCGLGKTKATKSLQRLEIFDGSPADFLLSGYATPNLRICVVNPMTSINQDNFEDIPNWTIIDGKHPEPKKREIVKFSNNSICTTWASYLAYEMYEENFDLFIFDEAHSFMLYNYREEIKEMMESIKFLNDRNKRIFLMSGTPGPEANEFDKVFSKDGTISNTKLYKIKIEKEVEKVNAEIVFYNNSIDGYIADDIKDWLAQNDTNVALIFTDKMSINTAEKFEHRNNLHIDTVYCKDNINVVDYVAQNHMFEGRVMASSVYGQAGINIYTGDKKIRIYILNPCGMSTIQYANRIRNKEMIDKIVVPYQNKNINNSIAPIDYNIDYDKVNELLKLKNANLIKQKEVEVISLEAGDKVRTLIETKWGLKNYYAKFNESNNLWEIDNEKYRIYELINRNLAFETQTQILYNRLVEANFNVSLKYLENDITPAGNKERRISKFQKKITNFPIDCLRIKSGKVYVYSKNDNDTNSVLSDDDRTYLGDIFTYILKTYGTDNIEEIYDIFTDKINEITQKRNNRFNKIDLKRWANIYKICYNIIQSYGYSDDWYLTELIKKVYLQKDVDLISTTATYVTMMMSKIPNDYNTLNDVIDEVYNSFKELHKLITDFLDFSLTILENSRPRHYIQNTLSDNTKKQLYVYTMKYLDDKLTTAGKENKDKQKEIEIDGIKYDSIKTASQELNVARRTIQRWLKNGTNNTKYVK